jgi:hypothetical protein
VPATASAACSAAGRSLATGVAGEAARVPSGKPFAPGVVSTGLVVEGFRSPRPVAARPSCADGDSSALTDFGSLARPFVNRRKP